MKKILTLITAAILTTTANAQILMGDMNGDNELTVSDVTLLVNDLKNGKKQYITNPGGGTDVQDDNFVDLGLSVKWAKCNLGATKPYEAGLFHSWGETKSKKSYRITDYFDHDSNAGDYLTFGPYRTYLNYDEDAATIMLGEGYRTPSHAEWEELYNNTYYTWTEDYDNSGVAGYICYKKKAGLNENADDYYKNYSLSDTHIFIPADFGYKKDYSWEDVNFGTIYWANDGVIDEQLYVRTTYSFPGDLNTYESHTPPYYGCQTRPVMSALNVWKVDNSIISGVWSCGSTPEGGYPKRVSFLKDGSNTWLPQCTYKYYPSISTIFFYDSNGNTVKVVNNIKTSTDSSTGDKFLLMGDYTYKKEPNTKEIISDYTVLYLYEGESAVIRNFVEPYAYSPDMSIILKGNSVTCKKESSSVLTNYYKVTALSLGTTILQFQANDEDGVLSEPIEIRVIPKPDQDFVDLGLPSGTEWGTRNIGNAQHVEEIGSYYAWGETTAKSTYTMATYKYASSDGTTYTKYTTDNCSLNSEDDVATQTYGSVYIIPSAEDWQELIDNCYVQGVTDYNNTGVAGVIFYKAYQSDDKGEYNKSSYHTYTISDPHIFIPSSGYVTGNSEVSLSNFPYYMSSDCSSSKQKIFNANSTELKLINGRRYFGYPVRPVRKGKKYNDYYEFYLG